MKVLTVVGARPQFVKAAVVSKVLRPLAAEVLVHTGQHYDFNMSKVFFQELEMPEPDYNLGIGSGSHGAQTGKMLEALEAVMIKEAPSLVLIYGDTNSTLAGALAAVKIHIPVAHVEAGLRSFNRRMPEEINRIMADHVSTWLLAPTATAVRNLSAEGIITGVHLTGDVMYDAFLAVSRVARERSAILTTLRLACGKYSLLTLHRAENTDDPKRLRAIVSTLNELGQPVIFPIHPRTRAKLKEFGIHLEEKALRMIEPVGYFDMLNLELNACRIFTDSGGVQKEAYMAKVPCITLRDETEWVETVAARWNLLVGADPEAMMAAAGLDWVGSDYPSLFGDGNAAGKIVKIISA
jgi:UDP-GlcNAc3NAcA epimerase